MATPDRIAWVGGAADGRVVLRDATGAEVSCSDLAQVVAVLQRHGDPWGGFTAGAAALGIALHVLRGGDGARWQSLLSEAGGHLSGLRVAAPLARLRACADRHADLLAQRENAARMLLEARRLVRTRIEAVAKAAEAAAPSVPHAGTLVLSWPGGPACDLGPGLLTGALALSHRVGRPDRVLVAGPRDLAADAVAVLKEANVVAEVIDAEGARRALASMPLSGVLARCVGDGAVPEPSASELVAAALKRRLPVIAVGVRDGTRAVGEPLPAVVRRHIVDQEGAGWETR